MSSSTLKMQARDCILRFKNGSPKLKDVLRKRCKERWKTNRENFVDKLRKIPGDIEMENTLASIIKQDLRVIYNNNLHSSNANSISIDDNNETIRETEDCISEEDFQWLMNKYDVILDNDDKLADMMDELNEVVCPVCQKNSLSLQESGSGDAFATCPCGLNAKTKLDLLQVKDNIMLCVEHHNDVCALDPQFAVINECDENHVYLICYACSNFLMLF